MPYTLLPLPWRPRPLNVNPAKPKPASRQMRPLFGNESAVLEKPQTTEKPKTHVLALPNAMSPEDVQQLIEYLRTRDPKEDKHKDFGGNRSEVAFNYCNVLTQNGEVADSEWITERGVKMNADLKAGVLRAIQTFLKAVHDRIEPLPDDLYTVIAVPLEYVFKAGDKMQQTLRWHTDSFLKFLGIVGLHQDSRIHGANLQVRSFSNPEEIQTFGTVPGQMLTFHNINAEHQVGEAEVDNIEPDVPALRNILTLGVKKTVGSGW